MLLLANVLSEEGSSKLLTFKSELEDCYIDEKVAYLFSKIAFEILN